MNHELKKDPLEEPVLKKERVYSGSYLSLDRLTVRLPDGRNAEREVVAVQDAVAILPVDPQGHVRLVRQHRPAIGRTLIEAPAGLIHPGEDPAEAAKRECEEETGFRPGEVRRLISYAHAEGYSTGFITLYLGTGIRETGPLRPDATEFLEPVVLPFQTLRDMVRRGEIVDSKTILCVLLAESLIVPSSGFRVPS
ncbi:MAG: NUDIX hydrolase [bacterium]|nr:NUDIX hydrolase [bacterium]